MAKAEQTQATPKAPEAPKGDSETLAKVKAHHAAILAHPQIPERNKAPEAVLSRISKRLNSEGVKAPSGSPYWTRVVLADYLAKHKVSL
jgi:hypothetical protein